MVIFHFGMVVTGTGQRPAHGSGWDMAEAGTGQRPGMWQRSAHVENQYFLNNHPGGGNLDGKVGPQTWGANLT